MAIVFVCSVVFYGVMGQCTTERSTISLSIALGCMVKLIPNCSVTLSVVVCGDLYRGKLAPGLRFCEPFLCAIPAEIYFHFHILLNIFFLYFQRNHASPKLLREEITELKKAGLQSSAALSVGAAEATTISAIDLLCRSSIEIRQLKK